MRQTKKKNSPNSYILFIKNHWGILTAVILCSLFIIAGILVSLHRFWQYEVFYYDFGIFDMALWNASRLKAPIIEHFVVGGKWIFADHFNPSIFLLTPLYWITERSEVLLIAQAAAVGLSGFILYLIGIKVLKQPLYALTILICYFLFVGLQNAVIADFHEVTIATLTFMLTYYFFIAKKPILYWLFLLITLGFKESNFLLGIGIGVSLFLLDRKQWKTALFTCVTSALWGIVAIKFIIPFFAGKNYSYQLFDTYNPLALSSRFIDKPDKIKTLFYSFFSFGFLPLISPQFWALLLQDFAARFIPPFLTLSWTLGMHYNALTAAIMGVGSMFSLKFLQTKLTKKYALPIICIVLILTSLILYRFVLRGPFALAYNPAFYSHTKDFAFLHQLVSQVPTTASVMTHNNLATRFTHQNLMLLRSKCVECTKEEYEVREPDYIVIDARSGQNPNNFYGITNLEHIDFLLRKLKSDERYAVKYTKGDQYIFKKR